MAINWFSIAMLIATIIGMGLVYITTPTGVSIFFGFMTLCFFGAAVISYIEQVRI